MIIFPWDVGGGLDVYVAADGFSQARDPFPEILGDMRGKTDLHLAGVAI